MTAVETAPAIVAIRVDAPGVYISLESAIESMRHVADQYEVEGNPSGAISLRWVADAWQGIFADVQKVQPVEVTPEQELDQPVESEGYIIDPFDIYRVEMFPDASGKWYARPISEESAILGITEGDFNKEAVETYIRSQWPDKEIVEVSDEMSDSLWDSQADGGRRRGPSPRRLFSMTNPMDRPR